MYTVYGNAYTRTLRVLWCLEEIGAPYTHVPGDAHSPEIKAVNPSGKVPALGLEDGTILDRGLAADWDGPGRVPTLYERG